MIDESGAVVGEDISDILLGRLTAGSVIAQRAGCILMRDALSYGNREVAYCDKY